MKQTYRDQYAHFIDTSIDSAKNEWKIEGYGLESLALEYNPQVTQYKTILNRNADSVFEGYQIQASLSDKRIYSDDPIYTYINKARRYGKAIETRLLEVDMTNKDGSGAYEAVMYDCLIVITSFLGENAVIGYDIYTKGDPKVGTVTIANGGVPTFTEEAITQD